jgi:GT2 family glycosyltransferase
MPIVDRNRNTGRRSKAQAAPAGEYPRMETSLSSSSPHASIITVNTNELHRLVKYLPSLTASRGDFEVLIADNGSQDGSLEYLSAQYPAVRTLALGNNLGFCAANNRAALSARGEFLVFLNPDTQVDPDWLVRLLRPFEDPAVGLTTAKILLMSRPDTINTCGNDVHLSGLTLCRGMGSDQTHYSASDDVAAVSGAAFAIRRDLFQQLGGFDEEFFLYMEETDLSCRARLAGWRCVFVPESIVWHDYSLRFGPVKVFYQERNRYRMLLKNYRWPTLLLLLPALLLAEAVTWGFVLGNDRPNWRNKLRAYGETANHFREILRRRKETQALRKNRDRDLIRRTGASLDFAQTTRSPMAFWAGIVFTPLFFLFRLAVLLLLWW